MMVQMKMTGSTHQSFLCPHPYTTFALSREEVEGMRAMSIWRCGYEEEDIDKNIHNRGALGTNLIFPSLLKVALGSFRRRCLGKRGAGHRHIRNECNSRDEA